MNRKEKIERLLVEYETKLGDILHVEDKFDVNKLPPFIANCVELVVAKTPAFSSVAAINTLNFALGHVINQTRTVINDPVYSSDEIGLGIYSVTISRSGSGKSASTSALISTTKSSSLFRAALLRIEQERKIPMLEKARKLALKDMQKDEESITIDLVTDNMAENFMEPLARNTSSEDSTRGGISTALANLQREEFGALCLQMDEMSMAMKSGQNFDEVTKLLTSNFDLGEVLSPSLKTKELFEEDISGAYINYLAHTSAGILFESDLMKNKVFMLFASSFSRRVWFVFPNEDESHENSTVPDSIILAREASNSRRTKLALSTPDISEHMEKVVDNLLTNPEARILRFTEEAATLYTDLFEYNSFKSELVNDIDVLQKLEISGRNWRIGKIAAVWSASIGDTEITRDTLASAIYFANYVSKYTIKLERMLSAQNYELLADTLKSEPIIPIATALTRRLIAKANPQTIAETLESVNSYLNKTAVVTYDTELKSFVYKEFTLVEPTTQTNTDEPSTSNSFTMSYRLVPDMPKDERKHHLESFEHFRDDLGFTNITNLLTRDGIYSTFQYKEGPSSSDPELIVPMKRNQANIISSTSLVVVDVDNSQVPMEVIHDYMESYQHILASTSDKSNTHKFRLLLPINVQLDGADNKLYSYVVRRIATELLLEADKVSFNPAQSYYSYLDSTILLNKVGSLFDITEFITEYAEGKVAKPTKKLHSPRTAKTRKTHIDKLMANVDEKFAFAINAKQGEGSYSLARACLFLIDEEANEAEMRLVINYINDGWQNPMEATRLENTVLAPYSARIKVQ